MPTAFRVLLAGAFVGALALVERQDLQQEKRYKQVILPVVAIAWMGTGLMLLGIWDSVTLVLESWVRSLVGIGIDLSLGLSFDVAFLVGFALLKRYLLLVATKWDKEWDALFGGAALRFYDSDEEAGSWTPRREAYVPRYFAVVAARAAECIATLLALSYSGIRGLHPCFIPLVLLEFASFLGEKGPDRARDDLLLEESPAHSVYGYAKLKQVLTHYFGDRLVASSAQGMRRLNASGNHDVSIELQKSADVDSRIAGAYFEAVLSEGIVGRGSMYDGRIDDLSHDRMYDTARLMRGESILFASPFYYDYIPYVFLPVNTQLLRGGRVLFLAGASTSLEELEAYITEGIAFVAGVGELWRKGRLSPDGSSDPDIALMSFAELDDAEFLTRNELYFRSVRLCVVIDPSSLLTTYQLGLSMLSWRLSQGFESTYCVFDCNSDGLVDALSHALRIHLVEVGATDYSAGDTTALFFEADGPQLQTRLLPGVARYLGAGTEIELVALHEQVQKVSWAAQSSVPLRDVRWIVGQYYRELFEFAELPQEQSEIDRHMEYCWSPASMPKADRRFVICEDERYNMFEVSRQFSTRTNVEGFICVLSPNYLMRGYMAENADIVATDPKALPSLAPDVSKGARNSIFTIAMELLERKDYISETEIARRLAHAGVAVKTDVKAEITHLLDRYLLVDGMRDISSYLTSETRVTYEPTTDTEERVAYIGLTATAKALRPFRGLRNVPLITEEPDGARQRVGSRVFDLVYQSWLPHQLVTFEGKYYEVSSISSSSGILLRRASDLFNQRTYYRQLRRYTVSTRSESHVAAGDLTFSNIKVSRDEAEIVATSYAYLEMNDYGDVANATVRVAGQTPPRSFHNKEFLRITLSEASPAVTRAIAVVISEMLVTLFPNDHQYLAVLTATGAQLPDGVLYELENPESFSECEILVVEDAPMDLGLLSAVMRNMRHILECVYEYLDWHETEPVDVPSGVPEEAFIPMSPSETEEPKGTSEKRSSRGSHTWFGRLVKTIRRLLHLEGAGEKGGQDG